jgi:tRNA-Thr(GGU) m(6)t(6)A37 methyltransferase TsaA
VSDRYSFTPIGVVRSPFREKFGIPRQPGLIPQARGTLELLPPYARPEALVGLEGYSHLWLQFVFHQALRDGWRPTVRPPRLGGNRRVGVFASRAPYRPNPLGLSVVRFDGIIAEPPRLALRISGLDLLDGTPVLDIKPDLPYVDALPDARGGFAPEPPAARLEVRFSATAATQLAARADAAELRPLITALLALDPRPAYHGEQEAGRPYGIRLHDFDLRWRLVAGTAEVVALEPVAQG